MVSIILPLDRDTWQVSKELDVLILTVEHKYICL